MCEARHMRHRGVTGRVLAGVALLGLPFLVTGCKDVHVNGEGAPSGPAVQPASDGRAVSPLDNPAGRSRGSPPLT